MDELSQMTEEVKEQPLPQVQMLMAWQKNMFFDAALQAMGYSLLYEAVKRNPEMEDPANFLDITFDERNNVDWKKFKCQQEVCGVFELEGLTRSFDYIADSVGTILKTSVLKDKGNIVAGTLRTYLQTMYESKVRVNVSWITKNEEK